MNTDTGEIHRLTDEEAAELAKLFHPDAQAERMREKRRNRARKGARPAQTVLVPVDERNLSAANRAQLEATGHTQISRNSPCPCGSRKRFKRCCYTGQR